MERPFIFVAHVFLALITTFLLTINFVALEVSASRGNMLADAEIAIMQDPGVASGLFGSLMHAE